MDYQPQFLFDSRNVFSVFDLYSIMETFNIFFISAVAANLACNCFNHIFFYNYDIKDFCTHIYNIGDEKIIFETVRRFHDISIFVESQNIDVGLDYYMKRFRKTDVSFSQVVNYIDIVVEKNYKINF